MLTDNLMRVKLIIKLTIESRIIIQYSMIN